MLVKAKNLNAFLTGDIDLHFILCCHILNLQWLLVLCERACFLAAHSHRRLLTDVWTRSRATSGLLLRTFSTSTWQNKFHSNSVVWLQDLIIRLVYHMFSLDTFSLQLHFHIIFKCLDYMLRSQQFISVI